MKKQKRTFDPFPLFVVVCGSLGAGLSYWWQVYQGSQDLGWNLAMAMMGLVAGVSFAMIGDAA